MLDQTPDQMPPAPDVLTMVWHSVTRMYWPAQETARVGAAVASTRSRVAMAHVAMEYPKDLPGGADQAELSVDGDVIALVLTTVERSSCAPISRDSTWRRSVIDSAGTYVLDQ